MNIEEMQKQEELTLEQKAVFFGRVQKALRDVVRQGFRANEVTMKISPRLYEQLVPFGNRVLGRPTRCFGIPVEPDPAVRYGTFAFEAVKGGVIVKGE